MTSYVFSGRHRMLLLVGILIGIACMALTWFMDDEFHTRFWTNYLHNSVFFMGIALMSGFFLAASITAWAGWYVLFKRIWEAFSLFLGVGLVLMLVLAIGNYMHWHHLYHWTDESLLDINNPDLYDPIIAGKAGFLNKFNYLLGTVVSIGVWFFLALGIRRLSVKEDQGHDEDFRSHRRMRWYAAAFLPLAGFLSAAMIWQWIMSIDTHWYSTMFAWYTGASWFVSMIALTILVLLTLKTRGYFTTVTDEHIHDLGKLLFAFSIFWTYLWFSQFMLIWYANIGEETIYFRTRYDQYPVIFYANLIINFLVPFFILMRNDTKRKWGSLGFVAVVVFFGHWLDFFQMIKPGALHTAHAMAEGGHGGHGAHDIPAGFLLPGFLELGTGIGFLCLFLFFAHSAMSRVRLEPAHDPYLDESLHHHA